nr:hypothetical protein [Tanacetum cinerariifolium]
MSQAKSVKAELLKLGLHNERNVAETANGLNPPPYRLKPGKALPFQEVGVATSRIISVPRKKYAAYPKFISCVLKHLLGFDYTQDEALGSASSVLCKINFHQKPYEVQPIELTAYMIDIIKHESLMSLNPSFEKVGKERKTHTVTNPKPKLHGSKVLGVPPKETEDCLSYILMRALAQHKLFLRETLVIPKTSNKYLVDIDFLPHLLMKAFVNYAFALTHLPFGLLVTFSSYWRILRNNLKDLVMKRSLMLRKTWKLINPGTNEEPQLTKHQSPPLEEFKPESPKPSPEEQLKSFERHKKSKKHKKEAI